MPPRRCVRSLPPVAGRLRDTPSDQAVRDALQALCPEPAVREAPFNRSFAQPLPKAVRRGRQRLASDLTLVP